MKKISTLIIALITICTLSCRRQSHVVIATQSGNYTMRLEYSGTMAFSNDQTKLERISQGGYIDYKRNNDELHASPDAAGHITYELNGTKINALDNEAQGMLDEAIRMIIKSSH